MEDRCPLSILARVERQDAKHGQRYFSRVKHPVKPHRGGKVSAIAADFSGNAAPSGKEHGSLI
jgi:hypothetical protein